MAVSIKAEYTYGLWLNNSIPCTMCSTGPMRQEQANS